MSEEQGQLVDEQPDEPVNVQITETTPEAVAEQPAEEQPAAEPETETREQPTLENLTDFDFQHGLWHDLPNFTCPHPGCSFATLDGNEPVADHYFNVHMRDRINVPEGA